MMINGHITGKITLFSDHGPPWTKLLGLVWGQDLQFRDFTVLGKVPRSPKRLTCKPMGSYDVLYTSYFTLIMRQGWLYKYDLWTTEKSSNQTHVSPIILTTVANASKGDIITPCNNHFLATARPIGLASHPPFLSVERGVARTWYFMQQLTAEELF